MSGPARIAIIGTGWWSTYAHIPKLQQNPDAELVAICDRDPEKLATAAAAYGIEQTYTDHLRMLHEQRPDGVIVATPHATHYALARDCLEHGAHLLIEKPMTLYAADARDLLRRASTHDRQIMVGYTNHFHPHAQRARDIMRSGILGKPQFVVCTMVSRIVEFLQGEQPAFRASLFPVHGPGTVYTSPELTGGGQGHLQLTHIIGLLMWVTGLRARRVGATMRKHGLPLDLIDAMTVEFEDDAIGMIGGSGNAYVGRLAIEVHCERGGLVFDMGEGTLVVRGADGTNEHYPRPETPYDSSGSTSKHLVDIIRNGVPNEASGEVGWRTVEILDAAYRSAAQGGTPVEVAALYGATNDE